ncbi:MAG: uracil phosphoribosyltransferase [Acidimicrobiia bacterium]|nr:MAG: uracil phosphoribosyltransferase [Acidimicrobiia bacterium]
MNLTVIDHPLTRHYLAVLRDRNTDPQQFRAAAKGLTYTLVFEATKRLPISQFEIDTPMETTTGYRVENVVVVPVLRAGLGLLDAVLEMIPDVKVGFAGVARDEKTALPQEYYAKLPDLSDATVLICEPMLATGGSLSWAVDKVKSSGATDITALCVVTAPEGVKRMYEDHPDVQIIAAAHDRELNDDFYIVPGLGDMGDRLFGTL